MSTKPRRRTASERRFRAEAVPRQNPDLHKLAQVFLGMALARAEADRRPTDSTAPKDGLEPAPEAGREVE